MACTVSHLRLSRSDMSFSEGLFVVVTRENDAGAVHANGTGAAVNDKGMETTSSASPSLSVTATDCDRCWSADDVKAKPDTTIDNWADQVACALAGGIGDGGGGGGATAATPSTFNGALIKGSTSHSVCAELLSDGRLQLSLSWKVPDGDDNRAKIELRPDDADGSARRRSAVAVALSSARAAGAAAAELSSQVRSLSRLAEKAQRNAMGWEAKWRAREGELFAKFCAVLNEKKREAEKWRERALAAEERLVGGGDGVVLAAALPAPPPAPAAAPDLERMPVDLRGAAEEEGAANAAATAAAAAAAAANDDFDVVRRGDDEGVEDREIGGDDHRNDSERSGGEEDELTEPGDWNPQSEGDGEGEEGDGGNDDDAQS